jgi:hypothetical protein
MAENFAFYSQTYDALPEDQMRQLAEGAEFRVETAEGGRRFTYRWPDLAVTVNEMPAKEVPAHLDGFCGYVRHLYQGQPAARDEQVLDRVRHTRLVAGAVIEPGREDQGRAEAQLGALA